MKIVAIGGGEKTLAISHALEASGDQKPVVLLNPSAASTRQSYDRKVSILSDFFVGLGATTSILHEYGEKPSQDRILHKLGRASLIYTIGGNSPYMLRTMQEHGTDIAIGEAIRNGAIHAGTSAGALLPFELAHSNVSPKPTEEEWDYQYLHGLGLIPGVGSVHANQHDPTPYGLRTNTRLEALMATFPKSTNIGYALDNGAAILFDDSSLKVIRQVPGANAHILHQSHDGKLDVDIL